jgi:hypothetical protein
MCAGKIKGEAADFQNHDNLAPSASIGKKMAYQLPYGAAVAYIAIPGAGAAMGIPIAAVPSFTPANPAAYAAFQSVDTDRSGSIDWKELRTSLGSSFGDANFPGEPGRWRVGRARALGEDIPRPRFGIALSLLQPAHAHNASPAPRPSAGSVARLLVRLYDDDRSGASRAPSSCRRLRAPKTWSAALLGPGGPRSTRRIPRRGGPGRHPSFPSLPPPPSPSPQAPSSTPSSRPCTGS